MRATPKNDVKKFYLVKKKKYSKILLFVGKEMAQKAGRQTDKPEENSIRHAIK